MAFRPVPVSTPAGVRASIRHDLVVEARAPVTRVIFALLLLAVLVVGTDLALRGGFLPRRSSNALWTERQVHRVVLADNRRNQLAPVGQLHA